MKSDRDTLPLSGVTVVEWSEDTTTALCGLLLADLGAEVTLVEPPQGSESRTFTPPLINGESALFLTLNRGKKSVAVDVDTVEGQRVLMALCEGADVVLEGMDPQRLQAVGIDYEDLKTRNAGVIWYSMNAYGSEGWYFQEPGSELEAQAVTGFSYLGQYTKPPVRLGVDVATTMAAICACQGILAALVERLASGEGQRGETSLLDGWVVAVGPLAAAWSADVDEWMHYPHIAPWSREDFGFQTKDLSISFRLGAPVTKFQKERWITFCRHMGLDHLIEDPWWLDNAAITIDYPMFTRETYEVALKKRSAAEIIDYVHEIGGVAAPMLDHGMVWSHPQFTSLEMQTTSPLPDGGSITHLRSPWLFSRTPLDRREGPPTVGQHTAEVLKQLGYDDKEIRRLGDLGVIRCWERGPKGG